MYLPQARRQRGQELDLAVGQLVVHGLCPQGGHHHRRAGRRHRLLAQEPASRRVLLATQVEGGMNFCSAGPTNKKSVRNRNLSELCQISRYI